MTQKVQLFSWGHFLLLVATAATTMETTAASSSSTTTTSTAEAAEGETFWEDLVFCIEDFQHGGEDEEK